MHPKSIPVRQTPTVGLYLTDIHIAKKVIIQERSRQQTEPHQQEHKFSVLTKQGNDMNKKTLDLQTVITMLEESEAVAVLLPPQLHMNHHLVIMSRVNGNHGIDVGEITKNHLKIHKPPS